MAQRLLQPGSREVWVKMIIDALGITEESIRSSARIRLLGNSDEFLKKMALDAEANPDTFLESFN